jgi:tetratricopeptide (TPR) repeat protein
VKPERNAFQKGIITDLETLQRLIEDQGFVPVECTGFVKSTTNPEGVFAGIARNADGFLEFDDAVKVGHKQLETKDFRFALDVEYLHQNNHPPYDPKSEELNILQEIRTIVVGRHEKPDDARVLAPPASRVKLFGRDADLTRAQNALQAGQTVLVHGMGGIGKTALALEVAKRLHESKAFPDGVLWINEVGRADVTSICDAVARALGNDTIPKLAADDPLQRQQKLLDTRQLLESKRLVLILDDLGSPQTAREFLEHCLPANRGVLFTSRRADLEHQESIELETLLRADAKRLFEDRAKQPMNDTIANDICEVLEDHPLALVIAAGRVRIGKMPPERLLERLRAVRLGTISQQGHRDKSDNVTVSIRVSFEDPTLTDDARTAFLNLSACFAETTGLELLSMLNKISESETEDRLEQLVLRSLVNREGDRYGLHALLRDYGRGELGDDLSGVQDRLIDSITIYTEKYNQITQEHLNHLEAELDNLLNGLEYARNTEKSDQVFRVSFPIFKFLGIRGFWNEQIEVGRVAILLAGKIQNLGALFAFTHNIAVVLGNQGRLKEANLLFSQNINFIGNVEDKSDIATSFHQFGILVYLQGDKDSALKYYYQSLKIWCEAGNKAGIASALHQIGIVLQDQGKHPIANKRYCQSLKIWCEIDDRPGISSSLAQLSVLACIQGDYDKSGEYCSKSLEISQELGDQLGIASSVAQFGRLAEIQGQTIVACQHYRQALEIFEHLQSPNADIARRGLERLGCP